MGKSRTVTSGSKMSSMLKMLLKGFTTGSILALLIAASGWSLWAAESLRRTSNRTTVDGSIRSGEYSYSHREAGMTLYANWRGDSLYLAVRADTEGWVAIGINAKVMDGAHIMIGFSDGGRTVFKEQIGSGNRHQDIPEELVQDFAIVESGGQTSMEVELEAVDALSGKDSLDVIVGYGKDNSLTMYHGRSRAGFSIPLSR